MIIKILFLDLETSPNTVFTWGLWQQNVSIGQIVETSHILCWAAKWAGDKKMFFGSINTSGRKKMLAGIHKLLEEADVVVHYNGKKFDIPVLNREFLMNGFAPPAPYKQVDMLQVSRGNFRFQSQKLDFVAQQLGLGQKTPHEGFQLWVKCMNKDQQAWKRLEQYNKNDVILLEAVYQKMLPWIKHHPVAGLYDGTKSCTRCGSLKFQARGTARSTVGVYRRYQCNGCHGWFRGAKIEGVKNKHVGIH